jgi:hypothetical protein
MSSIESEVSDVVAMLVRGDYDAVVRRSDGKRLTAAELEQAVADYGRTLTQPGTGWWDTVEVRPVGNGDDEFYVAAPLWTEEEGRSDLTLELSVGKSESGDYRIEVDDLHVL